MPIGRENTCDSWKLLAQVFNLKNFTEFLVENSNIRIMEVMKWKSWWWVALFIVGLGCFYYPSIKDKNLVIKELEFRLEEMQKKKMAVLQEREELVLKTQSQNDPAWIEMVLMRDLGVVPEGWLKVHFKKS